MIGVIDVRLVVVTVVVVMRAIGVFMLAFLVIRFPMLMSDRRLVGPFSG